MASGYIGKISAVVTANTSDLSKKLRGSIQDWNKFGSSLNSSLNRFSADATKSIEKIFTPIQQLERKLKAAVSSPLNVRTGDQANQIRRIASAAEQINAPLQAAAGGFQKLSTEVQAGFVPALERAQRQAETLFSLIQAGKSPSETAFAAVQSRVERTTQALQRLAQAQQIASRGFTGTELQFSNPALFAALDQSSAATKRAGGLSPSALDDGVIAGQVQAIQQYQQEAIRAQSVLESLNLTPEVDPSAIESQKKRVNDLIETIRRARQELSRSIDVRDGSAEDAEIKALIEREKVAKRVEASLAADQDERRKKAQQAEDAEIKALIARERAAAKIEAATNREQAAVARLTLQRRELAESLESRSSPLGLSFDLDTSEFNAAQARLNILKQTISSLSSSASAPAEAAISRLGQTISSAMKNGTIRAAETKREIERLTTEAVEASAAVAGINSRALGRTVARAGDVGRRGIDNFSLALNQAAFAVDDFFSATGGLEFKIRAVQNNLTQLGFILGGTAGLFASLGFVIAGQATIALINFLNEGRKTEDMVKALTDSLSRQKEVASDVKSTFEEISRELQSDVFSEAANDADRLTDRLESLTEAFRKLREERILQASAEGQRAQADINRIQRQIGQEEDPGRLVLLQRDLLRARQAQVQVAANAGQPVGLQDAVARFAEAIRPLEEAIVRNSNLQAGGRRPFIQQGTIDSQVDARVRQVLESSDLSSLESLRTVISQRSRATENLVNDTPLIAGGLALGALDSEATAEVASLSSLLASIQGFQQAGDALSRAAEVSDQIRKALAAARERIEDFGDGVDSAQGFSDAIDAQGRILSEAVSSISQAFTRLDNLEITPEQFLVSLNEAAAKVDAEAGRRQQLVDQIAAVFNEEQKLRRDNAKKAAEEAERERQQTRERAKEEFEASVERGRQILIGERGRRAEQVAASIGDIRNAGGGQRAVAGFLAEQARQIAPAVFAAGEQLLNAVASGPNRAALSASDITTQQGTSELNRLLRGDDPAREQNIVELRKQTAELVGLREDLKNLGVAN